MISPSIRMRSEIRELVERSFNDAYDEIGEAEFEYVERHMVRKLRVLRTAATSWINQVARHAGVLYAMYTESVAGNLALTEKEVKLIGAALFYFVNPYDIIPDHIPGEGYLDDAHVLNLCVKKLRKSTRTEFEERLEATNENLDES